MDGCGWFLVVVGSWRMCRFSVFFSNLQVLFQLTSLFSILLGCLNWFRLFFLLLQVDSGVFLELSRLFLVDSSCLVYGVGSDCSG